MAGTSAWLSEPSPCPVADGEGRLGHGSRLGGFYWPDLKVVRISSSPVAFGGTAPVATPDGAEYLRAWEQEDTAVWRLYQSLQYCHWE